MNLVSALWNVSTAEAGLDIPGKRGTLENIQYRNTVRNIGKYRNTASKIDQIPQYRKKYWQIPKYCVKNRLNTDTTVMIGHVFLKLCSITRVCLPQPCMHQNNLRHCEKTWEDLGRDAFNQNFRKVRSKTQWIGLVQPEKFRKNWSTFWGRPLFPVGPVEILVEWIAPLDRYYDRKQGN